MDRIKPDIGDLVRVKPWAPGAQYMAPKPGKDIFYMIVDKQGVHVRIYSPQGDTYFVKRNTLEVVSESR